MVRRLECLNLLLNALLCIGCIHTWPEVVPGGMSVLLVPRLRLCVPRDYPSHTTRRRPVRYIWLHMATCVMGPKAGDADFQQR